MHTITIGGNAVNHDQLAQTVELNKNIAETHVALYEDVSECPDELYRAWNVAMVMSGEAVIGLAHMVKNLIGNAATPAAAAVAYEAFRDLYAANRAFYSSFSDVRYGDLGESTTLPEDLAARKAALPAAYAKLQTDTIMTRKLAEAMPDGPAKIEAQALAQVVGDIVDCIGDTVKTAENTLRFTATQEQLDLASRAALISYGRSGLSAEQALAKFQKEYGATTEEQLAALGREVEAPFALGSEGTMNGATLSAEKEIIAAAACLKGLVKLIG